MISKSVFQCCDCVVPALPEIAHIAMSFENLLLFLKSAV